MSQRELDRARAGVRVAVTRAADGQGKRWQRASRTALLALLSAGALAPVVAAAMGGGAVVIAGVAVIGSVGSNVLTTVVENAIDKLRPQRGEKISLRELEAALAERLEDALAGNDAEARQLRAEVAAVLREVGAAGEAINAAVRAGDQALQAALMQAFGALATEFSEFGFLLAETRDSVVQLQQDLFHLATAQRHSHELSRQQATQVRLIREQLADMERVQRRGASDDLENARVRWRDQPPYRGLWPFQEDQAEVFYGRDRATAELVGRLEQTLSGTGTAMMAVTGASGSGKSSLLRAGLLPAVARGQLAAPGSEYWPRLLLTPTAEPFDELAAHLAAMIADDAISVRNLLAESPEDARLLVRQAVLAHAANSPRAAEEEPRGQRLLLVVDQFEDLFIYTTRGDEAAERQRRAYIAALSSMASPGAAEDAPAVVAIGVRGDFLDRCAAYDELVPVLQDAQFVVGPMTGPELRRAITGPAAAAGLEIDSGLVDDILAELREISVLDKFPVGSLPLLSQAMLLTWQHREGHRLTRRSYDKSGGVTHAVQTSADAVYNRLSEEEQAVTRQIFQRLTIIAGDGVPARRRAPLAELRMISGSPDDADQVTAVLEEFTTQRIVVVDDDSAQISHDTLLRAWPQLQAWLEDDKASRIIQSQLTIDANEWQSRDRDPSFLYRGTRLEQVRHARTGWDAEPDRYPPLNDAAKEFLEQAQRSGVRATRIRHAAVAALVTLLVAASTAAALAANTNRALNEQLDLVVSRQLAAQSQQLADRNPELSRLLAAAAWQIEPTPEARASLTLALQNPTLAVLPHATAVRSVAFSPDGTRVATASLDGTARVWDADAGEQLAVLVGHTDTVEAITFSPDGTQVATASADGTARVWDADIGEQLAVLAGHTESSPGSWWSIDTVEAVTFSSDGTRAATTGADGTARVWDADSGEQLAVVGGEDDRVRSMAYGADGLKVAATQDGHTRIMDAITGEQVAELTPSPDPIASIVFSPDARSLATENNGSVWLWDTETGKNTSVLAGLTGNVTSVVFSPDGTRVATVSRQDNPIDRARVWDATTGIAVAELAGDTSDLFSVVFSPDGTKLASVGRENVTRVWDAESGALVTELAGHTDWARSVVFSPDSTKVATAGGDGTARVWSLEIGAPAVILVGHSASLESVTFSPDGRWVATTSDDNTGRIWDSYSGAPVYVLRSDADSQQDTAFTYRPNVVFSSDVTRAATYGTDGTVRIWSSFLGGPMMVPAAGARGHPDPARPVAFSPDGTQMATTIDGGTAQIWDSDTGEPIAELSEPIDWRSAEFSQDGTRLATASADRTARIWDTNTGEQIAHTTEHAEPITDLAFSPDGTFLATASADGIARIWDPVTGRLTTAITAHPSLTWSVVFSPDGTRVATASGDGTARLWDAKTGEQVMELTGHTSAVWSAVFSPDGTLVATVSADRTARVWDAKTGEQLAVLAGHAGSVRAVFSPDGSRMATASGSTGRIWDMAFTADPYGALCASRPRQLTQDEWRTYIPDAPYRKVCG